MTATLETDRDRRARYLERCLAACDDPERALRIAERMEWFITGRDMPVLSLPAPASDDAGKCDTAGPEIANNPPQNIPEIIPATPIADEAEAVVESAREVQRFSADLADRAGDIKRPLAQKGDRYRPEEDATIRRMFLNGSTPREIAKVLGRPAKAVEVRIYSTLKLRRNRPEPAKPTVPEDQSEIDRFIAEKGVTRCPTAAVAATTATMSDADRAALQARGDDPTGANDWRAQAKAGRDRYNARRKAGLV